jgi:hypothetical protein
MQGVQRLLLFHAADKRRHENWLSLSQTSSGWQLIENQATKLGKLYTDLAKEAFKPYEGLTAKTSSAQ